MSFDYEWDEEALEQFLQILTEIKEIGGYKKKTKIANEVVRAIGLITIFPQSGVNFEGYDNYQYFVINRRYRLIYQVDYEDKYIRIEQFWDGRRNPDDLQRWFENF